MQAPAGTIADEELYERCRQGDSRAFERVYDMCASALYGTALRMLGRPEEAEDVVQESFLKLYTANPRTPIRNLRAWLHRVTANGCLDRLRQRQRHGLQALVAPTEAPRRRDTAIGLDIERAVRSLPNRAREVFLLHDVEGFRHREVAEMLGIGVGTSKSQLFRARALLRGELIEDEE